MTGRFSLKPSQLMSPPPVSMTVNGVPCESLTTPDSCHPPRICPTRSRRSLKIGSSHDPLNVNRCGVWKRDKPRAKLLSGPRLFESPAPTNVASDVSSIDLLHVYVAENHRPLA